MNSNGKRQTVEVRSQTRDQWHRLSVCLLPFALLLFTFSCANRSGAVPSAASSGLCPVCHMRVSASDPWAAEIHYRDGSKLMFESPGDLLAFYTSPASYNVDEAHKNRDNIEKILVKDYQSKQQVDALHAKLVYKSRIDGPMGPDFLPFANQSDADAFVAANGGTLLALNEVTGEMVRELRK